MIDPTVRAATAADVDQLALLEREARVAVADVRGGDRWLETHPARTDTWNESIDTHTVHVAHIDEVLVGYVVLVVEGEIAEIADVFVTTKARELGFGDELLASCLTSARRAGCAVLEGSSLPGDRDTKNLYERAGIKARLITVSTPL